MRSSFEPKHLQRAKETLHRQLETVKEGLAVEPESKSERREKQGIKKRVIGFLKRWI